MNDVNILKPYFEESSILSLENIFAKAKGDLNPTEKSDLNLELSAILRYETIGNMAVLYTSPNGENHIVLKDDICVLINIYGVVLIQSYCLFLEGEMCIKNISWFEEDKLVMFDCYYIVHNESQKCICYYSNDSNAFCRFTELREATDISPWTK